MAADKQAIIEYVDTELKNFYPYLELPSISTQASGINETVDWLINKFIELGADRVESWDEFGGNPLVFAEFKADSDRTILMYNHYDVQPPEPYDEWLTEPFTPTLKDGKLYARGVADDKSELIARMSIVKYFLEHGGLPVNIKFIIEGEEELGSTFIDKYIDAHQADLAANVCIWEGGAKNEDEQFQVTCGLKGITSFDLEVDTADVDMHSSLASFADNAAWRLVQALATLKDANDKILVDGFYADIDLLDETTKKAISAMPFNAEKVKSVYGLKQPFLTDNPKQALMNGTTITINGLSSGYEDEGTKTVIPKRAIAKIDCRLVPHQTPEKIMQLVRQHLDRHGYQDIKMTNPTGTLAYRTDLNDPFVQLNLAVAADIYGEGNYILVPNMPGSGPAAPFGEVLGLPVVLVGAHYNGSGAHSPNEHIRLQDYYQFSCYLHELIVRFGAK